MADNAGEGGEAPFSAAYFSGLVYQTVLLLVPLRVMGEMCGCRAVMAYADSGGAVASC